MAGCAGVGESAAWLASCPQGNYVPQSLDRWFRSSWSVTQGRRGPHVEGYIYSSVGIGAERMLLAVERLDASGQAIGCSTVWVQGAVPPDQRAYFAALVPDASARYQVRILSFSWANKGGA